MLYIGLGERARGRPALVGTAPLGAAQHQRRSFVRKVALIEAKTKTIIQQKQPRKRAPTKSNEKLLLQTPKISTGTGTRNTSSFNRAIQYSHEVLGNYYFLNIMQPRNV